jgi:hypothetical protein
MKTTLPSPVALLDIDGVFYDYVSGVAYVASEHLKRPITDFPGAKVWNFFKDQWGLSTKEYLEIVDIGVERYGLIRSGQPFDDAIEGYAELCKLGIDTHIATNLGVEGDANGHRKARVDWLTEQGFDLRVTQLTFTPDKAAVAQSYLDEGRQVFALEDHVGNYEALNDVGATAFLLTQDWNLDAEHARRVSTVLEFAHQVEQLLAV